MARQKKPFDAVQFTRESAERVARVVRQAELTPAGASPLTFDKRFTDRIPKQVRAATFSGAWPIGSVKTVTLQAAPTVVRQDVINTCWPITNTAASGNCVIGKDGTSWYLVAPQLREATAVVIKQTIDCIVVTSTERSSIVTAVSFNDCELDVTFTKKPFILTSEPGMSVTETAEVRYLTINS